MGLSRSTSSCKAGNLVVNGEDIPPRPSDYVNPGLCRLNFQALLSNNLHDFAIL